MMARQSEVVTDGGALAAMGKEVFQCNEAHGWFEADRTFGEDIALLHSELSEALEAWRDFGGEEVYRQADGKFAAGPVSDDGIATVLHKPEGIGSELADTLIRLLDTAHRYDIDLFAKFREKLNYNWTREHLHGGKSL